MKSKARLYDALEFLPCSRIEAFRSGYVVYSADHPPENLYVVIDGRVKLSRSTEEGEQVVVAICGRDEFFGESAFLQNGKRPEDATALDDTKVMSWPRAEVEALIFKRPLLGMALVQSLAARVLEFSHRIESFSLDAIGQRVARCLLGMALRMGNPSEDGWLTMGPVTHELLSQYAGTSREIVTLYMNRLRRAGAIAYSRSEISLHPEKIGQWIRDGSSRE